MTKPGAGGPADQARDAADLFDLRRTRENLGFLIGALRRRRGLALGVFLSVLAATLAALVFLPKSYHTETKLLAQRNQVMAALGNPGRAIPGEADAPTRAASELVLRHDNLLALVEQTHLMEQWSASRGLLLRLKDFAVSLFAGPVTEEDKRDALVGLLEKRLKVSTGEGTVTISIDWPDAQVAYRLVDSAQQNFLETRHATEVSAISEAISILELHSSGLRENIQGTLESIRKAREGAKREAMVPRLRRIEPEVSARPDPDLEQVRSLLAAKRRAIADLEEYRRRRIDELQAQLAEQKATYAPAHPVIQSTQERLEALSKDSPQTASLRREERALLDEYVRRGGKAEELDSQSAKAHSLRTGPIPTVREIVRETEPSDEDPSLEYGKAQLRIAINKYEDLLSRIDAARIELDTARAAFKYRYSVLRPAQVPKKTEKPKPAQVVLSGFICALMLSVMAPVLAELRLGRMVEPWQIERALELPVLGEVRRL